MSGHISSGHPTDPRGRATETDGDGGPTSSATPTDRSALVDRGSVWSLPGTRTRGSSAQPASSAAPIEDGVFRCTWTGEVDFACREQLSELVRRFTATRRASAEVDVADVTFVDSTALTTLLSLRRVADGRGGRVVLVAPGRQLQRLLEIAAVTDLFVLERPRSG